MAAPVYLELDVNFRCRTKDMKMPLRGKGLVANRGCVNGDQRSTVLAGHVSAFDAVARGPEERGVWAAVGGCISKAFR